MLEEPGRATDPTPYLVTMMQFAPLAPEFADPARPDTAVFDGVDAVLDTDGWVLSGTVHAQGTPRRSRR